MRALVFKDFGSVGVEDVPKPKLEEPGDALVRVTMSAICGSDLHVLHGRIPGMTSGGVLGHEFVGVVEQVSPEVTRFHEGDRVVGSFLIPCGQCWFCGRGLFSRCPDQRVFGYGSFFGDVAGAQAEYVRVPKADLTLHALHSHLTDEHALFVGDIFTTGYDCAVEAQIRQGDTVAVVGCGPVGLMAILAARSFGPEKIYAIDTVSQRLEMAQSLGAVAVDANEVHAPSFVQDRTGGRGADAVLKVPVGTQIFDEESGAMLADLTEPGERVVVAEGGNGGFGNLHFTTSTNRAPRRANPGLPGIERTIILRLKLIADAGLIGLPNAGKSTFLAAVSAAKPKIADYPFTTLHPGLGVVRIDGRDFVLADIPGLIEGAHEGHGLGDRFLGHVERCGALVHLVDATGANAGADYRTVRRELAAYGEGLGEKAEIAALSKVDAVDEETLKKQTERLMRVIREFGPPSPSGGKRAKPLMLSTATRAGVTEVLRVMMTAIEARRGDEAATRAKPVQWAPTL